MVEEEASPGIQGSDGGHVLRGEFKVEDVEIFRDAFPTRRPGNRHHAALDQPALDDLRNRLLVRPGD